MWTKWAFNSSAGWFKSNGFGFGVHLLVLYCIEVPSCQSHRQGSQAQLPSDVHTAEIDLFQLRQKKETAELKKKRKCRFPSWIQVPGQSTWMRRGCTVSILEVFINQRSRWFQNSTVNAIAWYARGAGRSMYSRDSINWPRPTTMAFYVRHCADGRKKNNQFDLRDLLFIPLETSFVLAQTLVWATPSTVRAESSAECQKKTQHSSGQPKLSLIRDGMHSPYYNEEFEPATGNLASLEFKVFAV
jgi:hypothetical protein